MEYLIATCHHLLKCYTSFTSNLSYKYFWPTLYGTTCRCLWHHWYCLVHPSSTALCCIPEYTARLECWWDTSLHLPLSPYTVTKKIHSNTYYLFIVSIIKSPRLTIESSWCQVDELFIKFWTLEGTLTAKGAAITIWRLNQLTNQIVSTMGAAITIWQFIANDQSNRLPKFL